MRVHTYLGNFAAEDISEGGEGVVHGLVVDRLIQVLDEDVANAGTTEAGIPLAPHDSNGTAFQNIKVHRVQSPFG